LEDSLTKANFTPLIPTHPPTKPGGFRFEDLARWVVHYNDIRENPAWKDFNHRLQQLREGTQHQLLVYGGLDKGANTHDIELRAVLHVLNTLLAYVPTMFAQYEDLMEKRQKQQAALEKRGPIHGSDLGLSQGRQF
jgi:hypothetical protein